MIWKENGRKNYRRNYDKTQERSYYPLWGVSLQGLEHHKTSVIFPLTSAPLVTLREKAVCYPIGKESEKAIK